MGTEIRLDGPPVFDDEAIIYRRSWAIEPGHVMHITSIVRHRDPFFQPSIIRIAHVSDGDIDTTFDGKRLFVSQGSNVAAYDCASGTERWTRQTDCFARMCCYEDMILAYGGGTLQCVDPDSGMTVITNEFADPISAVVVGGVGNRFFVFEGGRVHAYGYSVPR